MPVSLEQVKWIKAIILIIVVENPCIKSFFFSFSVFQFSVLLLVFSRQSDTCLSKQVD